MRFVTPRGLFGKLLVYQLSLLIGIILALFVTLSLIEKKFWGDHLIKEASNHLRLLNPQIMRSFGRGMGRERADQSPATDEIRQLLRDKPEVLDVSMADPEGKTLFAVNDVARPAFALGEYTAYRDILYRDARFGGRKVLDIAVPFQTVGRSTFYLRYFMHFPALEQQMTNINLILLGAGLVAAAIAFMLSSFYVRRITGPLSQLTLIAKAIRRGEIDQQIPRLDDEIGELAEALRTMLHELRTKQDELMRQNERLNNAFNEVLFLQNQMLNYEKFAALGKISAGMSHEIDNPLGIIIGHAEYLKDELPADSPTREDVDTILREALRIKGIMRSLLGFAKPKESTIRDLDLVALVKKIVDDFSFQKIFRKIELSFSAATATVQADEEKLHQVLVNVILNAIQAMPDGGRLSVDVRSREGAGVVTVHDTGSGIPDELKNRVFDIFFSTKKDGTGLGLAVSKSFMDEMGGGIVLDSTAGGTTVTLRLPLSS